MNLEMWASVLVVGFVGLVTPFALRKILIRGGIFDVPNERSSHKQPTVRGGGIAALLAFTTGGLWLSATSFREIEISIFLVLLIAICVGLVGLVEDIKGLKISVRASMQLLAGLAIGFYIWHQFSTPLMLAPLIAFIFAFHVNLTNFMDGINGMSGLHGFVGGAIFFLTGLVYAMPWLVLAGAIISIAFVTFLPWNLSSPGMFLGDVGSYLLGASVGATTLIALADGVHPLLLLAAVGIYWADTVFTLLHRLVTRAPIFKAHRSHIYQQLTDTGLSHVQVAMIIALLTLVCSSIAFMVMASYLPWLAGLSLILTIIVLYLCLPKIRGI